MAKSSKINIFMAPIFSVVLGAFLSATQTGFSQENPNDPTNDDPTNTVEMCDLVTAHVVSNGKLKNPISKKLKRLDYVKGSVIGKIKQPTTLTVTRNQLIIDVKVEKQKITKVVNRGEYPKRVARIFGKLCLAEVSVYKVINGGSATSSKGTGSDMVAAMIEQGVALENVTPDGFTGNKQFSSPESLFTPCHSTLTGRIFEHIVPHCEEVLGDRSSGPVPVPAPGPNTPPANS